MILGNSIKVCLAVQPCDMRKSFDGLSAIVFNELKDDLKSSKLFVFCNKTRTRVKMLYWDGSGLWVMAKRLEKGTFSWPATLQDQNGKANIKAEALHMLLNGIDLKDGVSRAWHEESISNISNYE